MKNLENIESSTYFETSLADFGNCRLSYTCFSFAQCNPETCSNADCREKISTLITDGTLIRKDSGGWTAKT